MSSNLKRGKASLERRIDEQDMLIKSQQLTIEGLLGRIMSCKTVSSNDVLLKHYTSFVSKEYWDIFLAFVMRVHKKFRHLNGLGGVGRRSVLSSEDELLLTIVKLRMNFPVKDLAFRFGVSVGKVSKILSFWIPFLSSVLSSVPLWASKECIREYAPEGQKDVRIVLDCTEMILEKPSDLILQSDAYSSYKGGPRLKALVGMSPNGLPTLIADLVPGRMSDKEIVCLSGVLQMLEPGDQIEADRGFDIDADAEAYGIKMFIPPFLRQRLQFEVDEVELTREIANLRIHVERLIRQLKVFKILRDPYPLSCLDRADDTYRVCLLLLVFAGEPLLDRV